jgi:PEP-CTERM motif
MDHMFKFASLLVLTVGLSSANTFFWVTPIGATSAGGPVSASATVDTSTNSVAVTLNDLLVNPANAGQLLSDFAFTLSSTPTAALGSTATPTGSLIDISGFGVVTANLGSIASWGLTSSGPAIHLNSLAGGATQTIIGPAGPGGVYDNANGSIAGNPGHNPFLNGTATFTFAVAGVTADTSVTDATFSFGTTVGDNVPGTCPDCGGGTQQDIPEPLSMFLMGGGLLGVGIFGKFRRA